MQIRELLQREVWSKRTSRKILVVLATVVAGFVSWFLLDQHWLTQSERNTGRTALMQIDSLQILRSDSDDKDFDDSMQRTQRAVEAAERAAWTTRDKQIASILSGYLVLISSERDQMKSDRLMQQRHVVFAKSEQDFSEKQKSSEIEVRRLLSVTLHSTLDN